MSNERQIPAPRAARRPERDGLLAGLLLGAGFLVACGWWSFHTVLGTLASGIDTTTIDVSQFLNPMVLSRLSLFAAAVLSVHLGLGLLAFGLARIAAGAWPRLFAGRQRLLVLACFAVVAVLVLLANASLYPSSRFAAEDSWLLRDWHGIAPYQFIVGASVLLLAASVTRFTVLRLQSLRRAAYVSSAAVALVAGWMLLWHASSPARATSAFATPHVVIIGIDSLRDDLVATQSRDPLTPNIDRFVSGAYRFSDAITPFARTYPSWVSILTGRHPVTTNARDNLMPRDLVHARDTLGDVLKAAGYHSVYATDEVRFANFDESFGFDQLITPPVGISDFLIGAATDLPLVNVLTDTRIGAWLFPDSHANRADFVAYRPEHFVARLDHQLAFERPGFAAIHLTLSHWPYSWAGQPTPTTPQEDRPAYRRAVAEADRQFGSVLQLLEDKGVLENAIVVVLSDHGEALGGPTDTIMRKNGTPEEIWSSIWGHGTSVLSPNQYRVLFAMRAFGRARLPGVPGTRDWPVSVEDIRPTLQEIVTGKAPTDVDGMSLLPLLAGTRPESSLSSRIRFTESGFSTRAIVTGHDGSAGVIREGIGYFEVAPATGWVQMRRDKLGELKALKQRAALSRDSLLAAIPSWTDNSVSYLFTDRRSPLPRRLQGRPDPAAEPEAARLWDALQARFPGELPGGSDLPRM